MTVNAHDASKEGVVSMQIMLDLTGPLSLLVLIFVAKYWHRVVERNFLFVARTSKSHKINSPEMVRNCLALKF